MLNLVYKDFLVHRNVIPAYLVVTALFATQVIAVDGPIAIVAMLAIMFTFATAVQDERSNSHLLLNSLPVTRQEIVTAKYVFHLAASLFFVGISVLYWALAGDLSPQAALSQLLIAMGVIVWYMAVFFPLYYWLGPRFVQLGMFILFIIFVAIVPPAYNLAVKHQFWGILDVIRSVPAAQLNLLLTVVTFAALLASWRTAVWMYGRKEF